MSRRLINKYFASKTTKSLSRHLVHAICWSVSVVLAGMMVVGYLTRVRDKETQIREKASSYADNLRDGLIQPLWNLNHPNVARLVDSFFQNDSIVGIVVYDDDGSVFYSKVIEHRFDDFAVKRNILYGAQTIGIVEIKYSLQELFELRRMLLITAILLTLAIVVATAIVISFNVGNYLSKPLHELIDGIKHLRLGQYTKKLKASQYLEFEEIVSEFNTLGAAIENNLKHVQELSLREGQIQAEMGIGSVLQHAMLPDRVRDDHAFIDWHYEPAAALAGDWLSYGVTPGGRYTLVAVGDVTGHGYAQSLVTMAVMGSMWSFVERLKNGEVVNPLDIVEKLNDLMFRVGAKSDLSMTASVVLIDRDDRLIRYVNAGHPFPICMERHGSQLKCRSLNQQSPMIGVGQDSKMFVEGRLNFPPDSYLVIFTDGLTEAKDSQGKTFARRFSRFLKALNQDMVQTNSLVELVTSELTSHQGGREAEDDVCVVAIDLNGAKNSKKIA